MDLIGCIGIDDCLSSPYLTSIKIIARIPYHKNEGWRLRGKRWKKVNLYSHLKN
jgi:hypothetical protein